MFNKVKKFELCGRICAAAATERLERMDILSGQNTECVKEQIIYIEKECIYPLIFFI